MSPVKYKEGDKVVHNTYGVGTVQIAGVNGLCRVVFDNGHVAVVKTSELHKYFGVGKHGV